MNKKLLELFKAKCKDMGLSDAAIEAIVTGGSEGLTDTSTDVEIETKANLILPFAKAMQSEATRWAQVAKDAKDKKTDAQIAEEKAKADKLKNEIPNPDEPAWFKSYREKADSEQAALKNKLEGYEKEKTTAQLTSTVTAKLKEKGIPESYFKGRNLSIEKEGELDTLINTIDADYTSFKQEMAEQGVIISIPKTPTGEIKEGEALGKSLAEKRNAGASEGVQGKKV